MALKVNQAVTIHYSVKDDKGNKIDSSEGNAPLSFISGMQQVIPGMENNIEGMLIGSKKTFTCPAEEAYGDYNENALQVVSKSEFPAEIKLEVGLSYVMNDGQGRQIPFVISEVAEENVTLDFNHPLAGIPLTFDIELIDIREATKEELEHGHVHGAHGHHH